MTEGGFTSTPKGPKSINAELWYNFPPYATFPEEEHDAQDRDEASVVAPVTPNVPPKAVEPVPTFNVFVPVTDKFPLNWEVEFAVRVPFKIEAPVTVSAPPKVVAPFPTSKGFPAEITKPSTKVGFAFMVIVSVKASANVTFPDAEKEPATVTAPSNADIAEAPFTLNTVPVDPEVATDVTPVSVEAPSTPNDPSNLADDPVPFTTKFCPTEAEVDPTLSTFESSNVKFALADVAPVRVDVPLTDKFDPR